MFEELTALTVLNLHGNSLAELPDDVFDELTELDILILGGNSLTELPDDVFDELTALTSLQLDGNSLTDASRRRVRGADRADDVFELRLEGQSRGALLAHRGCPAR